jgi:hypothetical protein
VGLGAPKPLELVEGFVPLRDRVRGVGNDAAPIGLGGIEVPLSPRCSRRWVPARPLARARMKLRIRLGLPSIGSLVLGEPLSPK